jgi:hypothetical protein
MGWPETAVRVIDDDLGMSGASSESRAGHRGAWIGWLVLRS